MASLLGFAKRAIDQINPLDNGRTYQNSQGNHNPGPAPSAFQQARNSGASHFVGSAASFIPRIPINVSNQIYNRAVVPIIHTPNLTPQQVQPIHGLAKFTGATGSTHQTLGDLGQGALALASGGLANGIESGVARVVAPQVAKQAAIRTALGLGTQATIKTPLVSKIASNAAIGSAFNATNAAGNGAKPGEVLKAAGIGLTAGGIPILGKGLGKLSRKPGESTAKISREPTKVPVSVKPGPRTSRVDVTVNKRIPVRSIPAHQELVDRYNAHMANLSRKYGLDQKQVTLAGRKGKQGIISEPSIINDVGYQAEKQQIETAYKNGTLSKPIKVTEQTSKLPPKPVTTTPKVKTVQNPTPKVTTLPTTKPIPEDKLGVGKIPINSRPLFGTPERVVKQITKDSQGRDVLTKEAINPNDAAVVKANKEVEGHLKNLRGIFSQAGILKGRSTKSSLGTHFFNFVEQGGAKSQKAIDSLTQRVGKDQAQRLSKADSQLRPILDDLFKRQNEARAANGKQPIAYRDNYLTHLTDKGFLGGALDVTDAGSAGSPFSHPVARFNPFSRERTGAKYKTNPVRATEAYVRAATAEIHSHEPVQRLNTLIDAFKQRGNVPNNVIQWLEQQRDIVGGQGHRLDQAINSTQLGKAGLSVLSKATQQAGKNLIGLNPASVLTQPAQLISAATKFGVGNTIKALSAPLRGEQLSKESQFLMGRHAHLNALAPGLTRRLVEASLKPIEGSQKAVDRIVFDAAQHRASQLGLKGDAANKWADDATKETVAARGRGQTPHAYNSKVGNAVLQFSLEMGNSLHQLAADELRHGRIGGITTFMIGAYGFNQAFNAITGKNQGVLIDPIQAGIDTKKDVENGNYVAAAGRLPGELLANTPGGQIIAGGIKNANKKLGNQLFGQAGAGRYGVGVPGGEALSALLHAGSKPGDAAAYAAPTGGVPIKRGVEGLSAVASGNVNDKKGNSIYKPAPTPQNYIRAGLFGKSSTNEGKQYSQDLQDQLTGNDTAGTPKLGQTLTPAQITKQTTAQYNKFRDNGESEGLMPLPDGRYAYKIEGKTNTTDTLKTARNAIAENALSKSDQSYKVIGDTVYRKGADGKVSETPKVQFDYQVGTATLQAQKNADDVQGYLKTARSQLDSIAKQMLDPSIDPLDRLRLQNDASTLQKNIAKYTEYGGFTKGSSGSSKAKARAAAFKANFKTASLTKAPKIKGVKVGKVASSKPLKTRKIAVSKMPKIA